MNTIDINIIIYFLSVSGIVFWIYIFGKLLKYMFVVD